VYVFAKFNPAPINTTNVTRLRYQVQKKFECRISEEFVVFRANEGPWRLVRQPSLELRHDDSILMGKKPNRRR
jgi:hypothetical protein